MIITTQLVQTPSIPAQFCKLGIRELLIERYVLLIRVYRTHCQSSRDA